MKLVIDKQPARAKERAHLASLIAGVDRGTARRAVRAAMARKSFAEFVKQAWHVHHSTPLIWGWHLDAIVAHLEAVSDGRIDKLLINIPPGFAKSLTVSVYWPSWEWLLDQGTGQHLCVSAQPDVVLRDSRRCHEVIDSPWFQDSFAPTWTFDASQDAKGFFTLLDRKTRSPTGGARVSKSIGQRVIGLRGGRRVVDDPIDSNDAQTGKAELAAHVQWYDQTFSTREQLGQRVTDVIIMQRLHELDLSGHLLARDGVAVEGNEPEGAWTHLCLPAEFDPEIAAATQPTSIGWSDPRTEPGELLCPKLLPRKKLEGLKRTLGPRGYAGQYGQRPAPAEGAIFRLEWLRFWEPETLPETFDFLVGSWDTIKAKERTTRHNDPVCGQTWGVKGARIYLLDEVRERMANDATLAAMLEQQRRHKGLRVVIVEQGVSGATFEQELVATIPALALVSHQGESKESRAEATVPRWSAGQIFLPHPHRFAWSQAFIDELLGFPAARHDDRVDAMTQALIWIQQNGRVLPWAFTL
ncbi:MAG: hypothetical protein COW42_14020 [Deltaproteobacteria bacterium CG17_big_fil_post_rev_8_21_14_2_50_63_7]|nr:MAG: hypothetical protein COW42_14020 [Deltaproteobacteria bacterium CG17_big_fil_post_rev_8_21_14_2_50_63_7]